MTKKECISNYFKLKIQSGEWLPGEKMLSENQIAIKFNCSRTTAREAIQPFVYLGIIKSIKGVGYEINDEQWDNNYHSISKKYEIDDTKIIIIKNINLEIKKEMQFEENEKAIFFVKDYYKNKELLISQITAINLNKISKINYDKYKKSISQEISMQGNIIEKIKINFQYSDINFFNEKAIKMGYEKEFILENIKIYDKKNDWIEKTLRINNKKIFNKNFIL